MEWQERIKKLTKERGWTQHTLADKVGYSQAYVNLILNSKRNTSVKTLKKFSDVFGLPVEYFLSGINRTSVDILNIPILEPKQIKQWLSKPEMLREQIQEWYPVTSEYGPMSYCTKVSSSDMYGIPSMKYCYPCGALIIVDPDQPIKPMSRVVVELPDGRVVFRELQESAGEYFLAALQPGLPIISLGQDFNAKYLGQVTTTIVKEKI